MPKLLQIDSCLGILSTGKITESIAKLAIAQGWECHIMHGARYVGKTIQHHYQVSSLIGEYIHYAESLLLDRHGLGSRIATKCIIKKIKEIKPDIIQLHCLHGYYINYKYLFEYLNQTTIPVIWTFHDCWAFTGHCTHFDFVGCERWKTECYSCIQKHKYPKSILFDRSRKNYLDKKTLFNSVKNLTIVPVSYWLGNLVKQSFLNKYPIRVIQNGIDINAFSACDNYKPILKKFEIMGKKIILGVASTWDKRKGLDDFIRLFSLLDEKYKIVLVGLSQSQVDSLPAGIIGIRRTENVKQLAQFYSLADVFVNPTYEDTFPTTNLEALACGTPVITYRTGGSVESVSEDVGKVVEKGNIEQLRNAIMDVISIGKTNYRDLCRERAVSLYNKDDRFREYLNLFNDLLC